MPDSSAIKTNSMHRTAPAQIDVSIAAMAMMGLLKYIERFRGVAASDIVWQSPPIETNVAAAIRFTRHEEYARFIEVFLREKHGEKPLPSCPACLVRAVVGSLCEACFTELDSIECPNCGDKAYYGVLDYSCRGAAQAQCECGATVNI
jgi:hypothetical protein